MALPGNMASLNISKRADDIATLLEQDELQEAETDLRQLKSEFPDHHEVLHVEAIFYQKRGLLDGAIATMHRATLVNPTFEMAYYNLGALLEQAQRYDEAVSVYQRLILISPKHAQGLFNLAAIMHGGGRLRDAESYYKTLLESSPYNSRANGNLGAVLIDQGRLDEALPYCEKSVMLALDNVDAHNNCGIIYAQKGLIEKAEKAFNRALKVKPNYEPAARNLAMLQKSKIKPEELAAAQHNLHKEFAAANRLLNERKLEEAIAAYESLHKAHPNKPEILTNLGMALNMALRFSESESVLKKALALDPKYADAWHNLGNLYKDQHLFAKAIEAYRLALSHKLDFFDAWVNLGTVLHETNAPEEALVAYKNALALSPKKMLEMNSKHIVALSMLIRQQQQICLWDNLESYEAQLIDVLEHNPMDKTMSEFSTSSMPTIHTTPAQQYRNAVACSELNYGAISRSYDTKKPLPCNSRGNKKIRIGYLSADYYNHATVHLIAGLFEQHDRDQFEIVAYSYGIDDESEQRARVIKAMDEFHDVRTLSDLQVAKKITQDGIDIAIDLKGYTRDHRMGILAGHPAPVQAHYLGYPGTTGASFMDYFIGDAVASPASLAPYFSEKLVLMPHSYQVNDDKRMISKNIPTRSACGLPETGVVFCSFNQNYKITPQQFTIWMRLLKNVPGSVLWLYITGAEQAKENLRAEAQKRGVEANRLVFAEYMPLADHLARYSLADLFLDTFPYNAHTTASDALWAGVPVVTYSGESFVSRVAASLLNAIGLSELATTTLSDYEALALKLAQDPTERERLRKHLREQRTTAPLFDTKRFIRDIEKAYLEMIERYRQGKPLEGFAVKT